MVTRFRASARSQLSLLSSTNPFTNLVTNATDIGYEMPTYRDS